MGEDGSIVFRVEADDKDAEKKLNQLRREIEKTARAMEDTSAKRNGIAEGLKVARSEAEKTAAEIRALQEQMAENEGVLSGRTGDIDLEEFNARKQAQSEITVELQEQQKLLAAQEKNVTRLEAQEQKVQATLARQTEQLQQQKAEAGAVERVLAEQGAQVMPQLRAATDAVTLSMRKGVRNILKWGFGIRSAFILMRRLRSAVTEGVKAFAEQDAETRNNINGLKSSLNTLKLSWGAAFAPILNAVAPLLQKLISWLTAVANAVQMFFAILRGQSSYKKVIAGNEALADSYAGAGEAAKKAEKTLMGFDHINKLNAADSGGGGGGGGNNALQTVEEAIDSSGFVGRLSLAIKDVLFNWSALQPEQIAQKAIAGLAGVLGAGVGFMIGGVPGAVIGSLLGVVLGLVIDALIFDHNGRISKSEIANMLRLALFAICGGIIGFSVGNVGGALIGATIGMGLFALIKGLEFKKGAKMTGIANQMATALSAFVGGVIGFKVGGIPGALLGATIGLGISFGLQNFVFGDTSGWSTGDWIKNIVAALAPFAGAAIGLVIGGPGGAAIGAVIGLGIHFLLTTDPAVEGENAAGGYFQGFSTAWEAMTSWVDEQFAALGAKFSEWTAPVVEFAAEVRNDASLWWGNVKAWWSEKKESVEEFTTNLKDDSSTWWNNVVSWWNDRKTDKLEFAVKIKDSASEWWSNVQSWWESISGDGLWTVLGIKLPTVNVEWKELFSAFGQSIAYPSFSVQWNAKGGIYDEASLIGVGEAGKEAVVPLERNTGWIDSLADSLLDKMMSGNRMADYITGRPLPAFASGQIVPPRAVDHESFLSDSDITRLAKAIAAALGPDNGGGTHVHKWICDGRTLAEIVEDNSDRMRRSRGR